jgi:anaerobic selenocysteine-containing dehydrogenase
LRRPFFGIFPLEFLNKCFFWLNHRGITPNIFTRLFLLLGQLLEKRVPDLSAGSLTFRRLRRQGFVGQGGEKYGVLQDVLQTPGKKINFLPPIIRGELVKCAGTIHKLAYLPATPIPGQFLLVGGRFLRTLNSWLYNYTNPRPPTLWVNPADAEVLNVQEGDQVVVENPRGKITVPAHLTPDVMPGVVYYPHGWGHNDRYVPRPIPVPGENVNLLTDSKNLDPFSGIPQLYGVPVTILKE